MNLGLSEIIFLFINFYIFGYSDATSIFGGSMTFTGSEAEPPGTISFLYTFATSEAEPPSVSTFLVSAFWVSTFWDCSNFYLIPFTSYNNY